MPCPSSNPEEFMETMEVETQHMPLMRLLLENLQGLQHGEVTVVIRNGHAERINRTVSDLVKARLRPTERERAA